MNLNLVGVYADGTMSQSRLKQMLRNWEQNRWCCELTPVKLDDVQDCNLVHVDTSFLWALIIDKSNPKFEVMTKRAEDWRKLPTIISNKQHKYEQDKKQYMEALLKIFGQDISLVINNYIHVKTPNLHFRISQVPSEYAFGYRTLKIACMTCAVVDTNKCKKVTDISQDEMNAHLLTEEHLQAHDIVVPPSEALLDWQ